MPRLADQIEEFIKELMEQSKNNFLEIQRNELAGSFSCAPSQINYVLTTRFTVDRGYYVESRRGGGGFIKITWIDIDKNEYIRNAVWNNIGETLSLSECEDYIDLFYERGYITNRESVIMKAVISEKTLMVPEEYKNRLRAQMLKTMLITILS